MEIPFQQDWTTPLGKTPQQELTPFTTTIPPMMSFMANCTTGSRRWILEDFVPQVGTFPPIVSGCIWRGVWG